VPNGPIKTLFGRENKKDFFFFSPHPERWQERDSVDDEDDEEDEDDDDANAEATKTAMQTTSILER
jgi:hypothetical protein